MPSTAEQPELLCNVLPTKPVIAWQYCFSCYSYPSMLYANKVIHSKKKKQIKETNKNPNSPTMKSRKTSSRNCEAAKTMEPEAAESK